MAFSCWQRSTPPFPESNSSPVYASVMTDLGRGAGGPGCFVTRNPQDFANPDVRDVALAGRGCRLLIRFADGLDYVRANS